MITSDFAGLAGQLNTYATQLCGGTISVNKYIGTPVLGSKVTTPWNFHVAGPGGISVDLTTIGGQVSTGTLPSGPGYSIRRK